MRNGKFKIGKYNIEPTTSVDTFPSGEYNAVNTNIFRNFLSFKGSFIVSFILTLFSFISGLYVVALK